MQTQNIAVLLIFFVILDVALWSKGQSEDEHDIDRRIIGGKLIQHQELMPWLVRLKGNIPNKSFLGMKYDYHRTYCGGSVLNEYWVLTAAHCIFIPGIDEHNALKGEFYEIFVGDPDVDHAAPVKGSKVFVHPGYNPKEYWTNDLAMIKLSRPLVLGNRKVEPVRVPYSNVNEEWPAPGQRCMMGGWGCVESNTGQVSDARWTPLDSVASWKCSRIYFDMTENRLCAGSMDRWDQHGVCEGDSGGPLVCKMHGSNKWIQAGVTSFTNKNAQGSTPAVFTRVSMYTDWIMTIMDRY